MATWSFASELINLTVKASDKSFGNTWRAVSLKTLAVLIDWLLSVTLSLISLFCGVRAARRETFSFMLLRLNFAKSAISEPINSASRAEPALTSDFDISSTDRAISLVVPDEGFKKLLSAFWAPVVNLRWLRAVAIPLRKNWAIDYQHL